MKFCNKRRTINVCLENGNTDNFSYPSLFSGVHDKFSLTGSKGIRRCNQDDCVDIFNNGANLCCFFKTTRRKLDICSFEPHKGLFVPAKNANTNIVACKQAGNQKATYLPSCAGY